MKHILLYFLLICGSFSVAYAQDQMPGDGAQKEQRIKALYVAYITQELKLNETEAQKFWPLHAQYDTEIKSVGFDIPALDREQTVLNIKKRYLDKFSRILGPERTNDFYAKDGEFRKKLVEKLGKMRQQKNMMSRPNKRMEN